MPMMSGTLTRRMRGARGSPSSPRPTGRRSPDQIGVAAKGPEHVLLRALDEAVLEADRLYPRRREPEFDPVAEAGDEGMEPVGENRNEHGARILPDHVELVGVEHRQPERLGDDERPPRLDEFPDRLGPVVGPPGGGHEDGVAGGRVEEILPANVARGIAREDRGGTAVDRSGGNFAGDGDPDAGAVRGGGDGGGRGVDSEQAEVHCCNCSPHRGK